MLMFSWRLTAEPSFLTKSWHINAVRLSNHTMALCRGCPVSLFHRMVVSLWFVMPTAATFKFRPFCSAALSAPSMHSSTVFSSSSGSCSVQLQQQACSVVELHLPQREQFRALSLISASKPCKICDLSGKRCVTSLNLLSHLTLSRDRT